MTPARLLIVEDENIIALDLRAQLQRLGYTVIGIADSGEDTLRVAETERPDLVLMDVVLHGDMDGAQTANLLRQRFDVPVVYITAYSDAETLERIRVTESYGYILKPFDERELQSLVEIALYKYQAERRLRESEAQLRVLFDTAPDAIVMTDSTNRITNWNPGATALFQYTASEAIGLPLTQIMPEHYRAAHLQAMARTSLTRRPFGGQAIEVMGLRKDGSTFPIEMSMAAWGDGARARFSAIIRDLTARKRAEAQVRQLSQAVEHSPATIIITDPEGLIEYVNPKFIQTTGYTLAEAIGQNPRILKSGEMPPEEYKRLWETITVGDEWRGEFHSKRKNGELYWEVASISSIKDEAGRITHFVAVKEDITARKEAEAALTTANVRLAQAAQEARELAHAAQAASRFKGQILANTSHELRTPLTAILGSLSLVLEGLCDTPEDERAFLQSAQQAGHSLLDLMNNLIEQARIEAGKMEMICEPVDLGLVLAELAVTQRRAAEEKHVALVMEPPEVGQWVAWADTNWVRQILINLLNNAIKFTERGHVAVRVRAAEARKVCVLVEDTGIGVPPEHQAYVFQPFVQEDGSSTRRYGGAGLGLSVSRFMAEKMGGELTLHSAGRGQGTTVTLILPQAL